MGRPQSEVILAMHGSAKPFEAARERIADDRRTQVPDMHLLGDIDAAHVDRDGVRVCGRRDAEVALVHGDQRGRERLGTQADIDEARTGNIDRLCNGIDVECIDDFLGEVARFSAEPLRKPHRRVGLEVAELGILSRADHRVGVGSIKPGRAGDGFAEAGLQRCRWIARHGLFGQICGGRGRHRHSV